MYTQTISTFANTILFNPLVRNQLFGTFHIGNENINQAAIDSTLDSLHFFLSAGYTDS